MKYQYTEFPVFIEPEVYQEEIDKMKEFLISSGKVLSVFQVGGVSNPGISDIDLYVVFKNDETFSINPVSNLSKPANYLFTHRLFGTCEKLAVQMEQFTLFRNYKLLAGVNTDMLSNTNSENDTAVLKHQIALEYLIKAWISISLSKTFKSIKLRNLLLHAKAILYDIDFLSISNSEFKSTIMEILEIRNNWFNKPVDLNAFDSIIDHYEKGLFQSIKESIERYQFYISSDTNKLISKRVRLSNGPGLKMKRSGPLIPTSISNTSKYFSKLQNKLIKFTVEIPITHQNTPPVLAKRSSIINEAIQYNNSQLPGFLCTAYGMNIFEIIKNQNGN